MSRDPSEVQTVSPQKTACGSPSVASVAAQQTAREQLPRDFVRRITYRQPNEDQSSPRYVVSRVTTEYFPTVPLGVASAQSDAASPSKADGPQSIKVSIQGGDYTASHWNCLDPVQQTLEHH